MSKRYAILGLSLVFALALAVPALGGPSNPIASVSATVKQTANKALKKAKTAQQTANSASSAAGTAQSDADKALTEAKKALTTGTGAQATATAAKAAADAAQGSANSAKAAADAAAAAAAAAEANANTRIKSSVQTAKASASNTDLAKTASATCDAGQPVLGGGFSVGGASVNKIAVNSSQALFYGGGWFAAGETIAGQGAPTWSITAYAMCGTK